MVKINYVHSMADQPDIYLKTHTEDGIGMYGEPIGPVSAEYLGLVKYNGQKYLIGRTDLAFRDDPEYIGKITVRRAMVNKTEYGADKDIFIDMDENGENEDTKNIEEQLSKIDKEEKITNLTLLHMADNLGLEVLPYGSMIQADFVKAISIKHQAYVYIEMCRKDEKTTQEESKITY